MAKLSGKTRDEARALLDQHADIAAALQKPKKNFEVGISLSNTDDDSDYLFVKINRDIAIVALAAQQGIIIKKLAELGIQVS